MNGNIHVPMSGTDICTILNSACGAGLWTMDTAQEYPHHKVIGLDIFNNNNFVCSTNANGAVVLDKKPTKNIDIYKYGDITTEWDIPDNSIDIIYQRDAIDKIPKTEWPRLLEQFKRVAKQGAYIELVEYKFIISDPGPALALMNEWHNIISASIGVDPNQADYLEPLLRNSGFEDVKAKKISIPVGEWPTDKGEREKGFLYKQVIQTMFKSMRSSWVSELGITDAEFTKVTNAALSEFEEQHASVEWVITTARTPKNN
ncbi:S-adenosyl-L-methionine-dependent methyltransferase [Backusella circina FSU 941]|nr:S-adenosyl-L-methionine-dependent methyltransferase [Backusella circina FSU 941]